MEVLFETVLGISLQVGIVTLILKCLNPLLNSRIGAGWKYLIWIFLAVRLLLPVNLPGYGMLQHADSAGISVLKRTEGAAEEFTGIYEEAEQGTGAVITKQEGRNQGLANAWRAVTRWAKSRRKGIALVWMMGVLLFFTVHFISYLLYHRRIVRSGVRVEQGIRWEKFRGEQEKLGLEGRVILLENSRIHQPQLMGFLTQWLVLPRKEYGETELELILRYELVHAKRGDLWAKLLFLAARSFHWFNPLVHLMAQEAQRDLERSCDDRVVRGETGRIRRIYGHLLLDELSEAMEGGALAARLRGGKDMMRERLKNIMRGSRRKRGLPMAAAVMSLTLGLSAMFGSVALAEGGRLVERYSGIGEQEIYYCSYSVYGDAAVEELEQAAAQIEQEFVNLQEDGMENAEETELEKGWEDEFYENGEPLHIAKFSFAFYREDTDELMDAFMLKDGERLEPEEDDVFVPGNTRPVGLAARDWQPGEIALE